jgi:hypothetical protein
MPRSDRYMPDGICLIVKELTAKKAKSHGPLCSLHRLAVSKYIMLLVNENQYRNSTCRNEQKDIDPVEVVVEGTTIPSRNFHFRNCAVSKPR